MSANDPFPVYFGAMDLYYIVCFTDFLLGSSGEANACV